METTATTPEDEECFTDANRRRLFSQNEEDSQHAKSSSCSELEKEVPSQRASQDSSSLSDNGIVCFPSGGLRTSTPAQHRSSARENKSQRLKNGKEHANSSSFSSLTCTGADETGSTDVLHQSDVDLEQVEVPIVGYETIEEREKFTVFKLEVRKSTFESWFIFRRYSDFERLKRQLKRSFPAISLPLPSKKWFGDNFDTTFLDERMVGLQTFIKTILANKQVNTSDVVKQFFCFDEPPGPYESLEESRALCESLEDQVFQLTNQLQERYNRTLQLTNQLQERDERIRQLTNQLQEKDDRIHQLQSELSQQKITDKEKSVSRSALSRSHLKTSLELDRNENFSGQPEDTCCS